MKHVFRGKVCWGKKGYYIKVGDMVVDDEVIYEDFLGHEVRLTIEDTEEVKTELRELCLAI